MEIDLDTDDRLHALHNSVWTLDKDRNSILDIQFLRVITIKRKEDQDNEQVNQNFIKA